MDNTSDNLPDSAISGAAFADSLVKRFVSQGKNPADLFITLAGLISGRSPIIGAECLMALEGAVDGAANIGKRAPSA